MSKTILDKIEKKISASVDAKEIASLGNVYAVVQNSDTARMQAEANIADARTKIEMEQTKLDKETEEKRTKMELERDRMELERDRLELDRSRIDLEADDRMRRNELEQTKLDIDAIVRKTQVENDQKKIENSYKTEMAKIKATSTDNHIMAGAMTGCIFLMYAAEKAGILMSRNAGTAFKFIRFGKII